MIHPISKPHYRHCVYANTTTPVTAKKTPMITSPLRTFMLSKRRYTPSTPSPQQQPLLLAAEQAQEVAVTAAKSWERNLIAIIITVISNYAVSDPPLRPHLPRQPYPQHLLLSIVIKTRATMVTIVSTTHPPPLWAPSPSQLFPRSVGVSG